jgi:hypothetical protein
MLSRIDEIIYPNRCEVIEFTDPQRFVYPIFKNGSTSLFTYANQQGHKIIINEQIKRTFEINIILRNPIDRFISGINEFVFYTKRSNPELDINTMIYFAENYLFLDRHYAPQLSWILNLNRYTNRNTVLKLHDMTVLSEFTPLNIQSKEEHLLDSQMIKRLQNNQHNEMYLRLDNLLYQLVGKEMTYSDISAYLYSQDPTAYQKLKCIALD